MPPPRLDVDALGRALLGSEQLTLEELRARDPQGAANVEALLERQSRARSADVLGELPRAARDRVRGLAATETSERVHAELLSRGVDRLEAIAVADRLRRDAIVSAARPDQPLSANPEIARLVERTRVREVTTIAGLDDAAGRDLGETLGAVDAVTDETLQRLVEAQKITEGQAARIGRAATLYALMDRNANLAKALDTYRFASLGRPAADDRELASLTRNDWKRFLDDNAAAIPEGATADDLSGAFVDRFSALHPHAAFVAQLPKIEAPALVARLTELRSLFSRSERVISRRFEELDVSGLSQPEVEALASSHETLRRVARAYPGLEIAEALDQPGLDAGDKAELVIRRINLLDQVYRRLGDEDALTLDYAEGSADVTRLGLSTLGATVDEQRLVWNVLKSFQRAFSVAGSASMAQALLAAGFASGVSIGRTPYAEFKGRTNLDETSVRRLWEQARGTLADVTLTAASVLDVVHGGFDDLHVANTPPTVAQFLKKLAGYEDLFGSLSFCDCAHCQSILSPAAYFVDLMTFVDEYIRPQVSAAPDHPLDLKTRRPDLWTLPLTCSNTIDRIPALEIVNEILENDAARRLGFSGSLEDRAAIADLVYRQTLAERVDSLRQPFHLPLARITAFLRALGHSRAEIADAVGVDAASRALAALGLSPREDQIITHPDTDLTRLSHVYGIAFQPAGAAMAPVDAKALVDAMGLGRADFGELIATTFVAGGGDAPAIVAEKRTPLSVQNDVERVHGLTAETLDRMQRLRRLQAALGWPYPDLDIVLGALGAQPLSGAGLTRLATLVRIRERHSIPADELSALAGPMPRVPAGRSLFDRLFNPRSVVGSDGSYPKPTARFVHPAFRRTTVAPADPALARLTAALGVDLEALATLVRALAAHLTQESAPGFDPEAPVEDDRYFVLSAANLTVLYRHARLSRMLGITVSELFELLALAGIDRVSGDDDVRALTEVHEWWRRTGMSLDDLRVATGRPARQPQRYPEPAAIATAVVTTAAASLTFRDTVFAVSLGTSEQGSRDLAAANAGLFESAAPDVLRLRHDIDVASATIVVPPTATVSVSSSASRAITESEVRDVLRSFDPPEVLARSLAAHLRTTPDKLRALAALVQQSLSSEGIVRAVRGDGPVEPLRSLIAALLPAAVTFRDPVWDTPALEFIRTHPASFSTEPLPGLVASAAHPNVPYFTVSQLQAFGAFARARAATSERDDRTADERAADLQTVVTAFQPGGAAFPPGVDEPLGRVLGAGAGLVVGLRSRVTLPDVAVPALEVLARVARLARDLGVDGEVLATLGGADYARLQGAAAALVAALGARHPDETARATAVRDAEAPVHARKRDALVDHLTRSVSPPVFRTPDDLYRHFLMDVSVDGCFTTSRVVAATGGVQQYVQRVRLNLEADDLPPSDPAHVTLRLPPDAAAEWSWRKNYRVWEANRKVFLWPENYIEPDLRDDKTPLFRDLEEELLQTDITEQNVLDAYAKYLKGFEEVASLTIAGAYHAVSPRGARTDDVLHLFGVSSDDPPTFYYRTCEHLIGSGRDPNQAALWTPWRPVGVQISGRTVSPVVHAGRLHVFWTDIKTRAINRVENGGSQFAGYQHKMSMRFTTLRLDGTWAVPQPVKLPADFFWPGPGEILDPLRNETPQFDTRPHVQAIDDYTLSGPGWEGVWLEPRGNALFVSYRNFFQNGIVDLFGRSADAATAPPYPSPRPQLLCAKWSAPTLKTLHYGTPVLWWGNLNTCPNMAIDEARLDVAARDLAFVKPWVQAGLYTEAIATLPAVAHLLAVPGSVEDAIVQVRHDVVLVQGSVTDDPGYVLRRIGTTLAETVSRRLFSDGLEGLLDIRTQLALAEAALPIALVGPRIHPRANTGQLDFTGPYGTYYREIFFHIPFLIANALNSRGRFAAAQRWYHYLFDPTANEVIPVPSGTPDEDVPHRLLDRVWRYREFRNLDLVRLRDMLTDETALALYKKDPFNPHAIARRRLSGYQKAVVMKYVDNLLDWADFLFTQFTMESVTEASMLYAMAAEVLGPRPTPLGACGEGGVEPRDYEHIDPLVGLGSEILVELESWMLGRRWQARRVPPAPRPRFVIDPGRVRHAVMRHSIAPARAGRGAAIGAVGGVTEVVHGGTGVGGHGGIVGGLHEGVLGEVSGVLEDPSRGRRPAASAAFRGLDWARTRTEAWAPPRSGARITGAGTVLDATVAPASPDTFAPGPAIFCWTVMRQLSPVFCVPVNRRLLEYWDRVEDRLFKIRHCMDITGAKRELALFAPEIEPGLLVRLKAAGLTLEDVLGASSGDMPPYRFLFLVDRAKAFAAALSGFGASLLSAIEKKDAEELARLRIVQTQNLSRMTTQVRRWDIETAERALEALQRQRAAAEYRRDYFDGLVAEERNAWEVHQSEARHFASLIYLAESAIDTHSAIASLMPQAGSPFAMKYGGVEIGGSLAQFGNAINAIALGLEAAASSLELEAGFDRRSEGWEHQKKLAEHELAALGKDIAAAEIRRDIAVRSLELHEAGLEQLEEMLELTDGKFSNLGLYTFLSTSLQRLHRDAYQNAMRLAKLAEQAFRFERGEANEGGLAPSYWDAPHGGLLAGERLLLDLQSLERRFLETNYRTHELDQAFALSQIDPRALLRLRETGECEFELQEVFFDLFYPGHYKRVLKNVRLTIPSITGPFANVSATLTLLGSRIRVSPAADAALVEVPPRRSVSIATSTAQNDAGVFELSFRDERYMPFEGAGAVSRWQLRLPRSFRQFDYETINDVVLTVSYTAEHDALLRERVEEQNAAAEGSLRRYLADHDLVRVLSLRQDFSTAFTRLLRSPAGTAVPLEITPRHFPLFTRGRTIQMQRGVLLLRTAAGMQPTGFELALDGAAVDGFASRPEFAGMPGSDAPAAFMNALVGRHTVAVNTAGALAPTVPVPGEMAAVDPDLLLDVFLIMEYRLT